MTVVAAAPWVAAVALALVFAVRSRRANRAVERFRSEWTAAGLIVGAGLAGQVAIASALTGTPDPSAPWLAACSLVVAVGVVCGSLPSMALRGAAALTIVVVNPAGPNGPSGCGTSIRGIVPAHALPDPAPVPR